MTMPTTRKDEYMENLANQLRGSSPQNVAGESGSGDDSTDYYEALKSNEYRALLSKEVQAYNAQEQARKYTQNSLRASGFGTQGLAESTNLGISNALGRSLRTAQEEYDQNMLNIAQQQKSAKSGEFEALTTLMGGASSQAELASMLGEYGYATLDKDGNFVGWNDEGLAGLDANTQRQLKILYGMYNSQLENNEWLSNKTINGTGFRDAGTAIQNVADSKGETGKVSHELRRIFSDDYLKDKKDGFTVKLVNGEDSNSVVYMIYRNGTWYQTTASVFNEAGDGNRETLKGIKE